MQSSLPISFIPSHSLTLVLLQAGLLLAAALTLGNLSVELGQPALIGELAAGLLLGPPVLGSLWPRVEGGLFPPNASQAHLLDAIGQVGVLLLVALAGVHARVTTTTRRRTAQALGAALGSLILPLALGIGVGLLVPLHLVTSSGSRPMVALFIGVALCVSALPVLAKILAEMGLVDQEIGRVAITAAVIVDVIGWCLLSAVSKLNDHGLRARQYWILPAEALAALIVAACSRPIMRAALSYVHRGNSFALPAAFVSVALLAAAGAQAAGLEAAFGAFLCGMIVSSVAGPEFAEKIRAVDAMVMKILAPLYFATIGLRMDASVLRQPQMTLLALVLLLLAVAGKLSGAYLGGRACGMHPWEALFVGGSLNARGVIEVIVAITGAQAGIINMSVCTIIIAIAVVTSCGTPPLMRLALAQDGRMPSRALPAAGTGYRQPADMETGQ